MHIFRGARILPPLLGVAVLVTVPVVAQAIVPKWYINSVKASTKHEATLAFGPTNLHNGYLENLECENFSAGEIWNEVVNGTERGFLETTGYVTWQCKASKPVKIKNAKGETVEGVFATAEGPPEAKTEKANRTGSSSLPWTGEMTEKEAGRPFDKTHHVKVWVVVPLCTEMGGTGEGNGCLLSGSEIPFEDEEGATEKAAGDELEPRVDNGTKNGLDDAKEVFEGEQTEKDGKPETGRLESGVGPGYIKANLVFGGATDFELLQLKTPLGPPAVTKLEPTSGKAGTKVKINGINFDRAFEVNFGSTPATSFTPELNTSLTAVAPEGSGTVDVTVRTPEGTSPIGAADQFTFAK